MSVIYDKLHGGEFYRYRNVLERTQWLGKEELRRLQLRKLKVLLTHAYQNVPYYHRLFKRVRFQPADFKEFSDMQRIPVLGRFDLANNFNDLVAGNTKSSDLILCQTSGTTAVPANFYQSKMEVRRHMADEARAYSWAGYETGDKVLYARLFGNSPTLAGPRPRIERFIRGWRLLGGFDFSEKSMESFCRKNRNFRPDFVHGGAGTLNVFALFLLDHREYCIRPKSVISYGQRLLPNYRKTIEAAFRCKVYDVYSTTEVPYVAAQCGHHEGLHVAEEDVFLEIEKDGETVAPGEDGRVLLTGLNGFAMPFIRYDVGDRGKMFADNCTCGRKLSLFKPVGRDYELFVHSDGTFTFLRDLQTVFEELPVEDYQIVQESLDEIVIRIVKKDGYTQAHTRFILSKIRLIASDVVKVKVELTDSVPLIGFGKVPHFVSKIRTKYT